QYAYQNGGGNISPLPGAPQKFIAANDYRRIYDLEHGRALHQERRNDLFPFANYAGHDLALQRQGLDGDVAPNINPQGQAARGGAARERRRWMPANPDVATRAARDPANTAGHRPDVEQVKIYVDNYRLDAKSEDLSGPPAGAVADSGRGGRGGGGRGGAGGPIDVRPMARGIWRITGGTMVIEFADHVTLFEV